MSNVLNELKKLMSVVDELATQMPVGFNVEFFKKLKSFNARVKYCNQTLKKLGSGSSRIAYLIDDDKILKLAKNQKGVIQNNGETDEGIQNMYQNVVTKLIESDEDDQWIVMELAKKVTPNEFKRITGYNFKDYCDFLYSASNQNRRKPIINISQEMIDQMWEDEFVYEITDLMNSYDILLGDLTQINSYGLVNRDGRDMVVLIDYGLNDSDYEKYYKK